MPHNKTEKGGELTQPSDEGNKSMMAERQRKEKQKYRLMDKEKTDKPSNNKKKNIFKWQRKKTIYIK